MTPNHPHDFLKSPFLIVLVVGLYFRISGDTILNFDVTDLNTLPIESER